MSELHEMPVNVCDATIHRLACDLRWDHPAIRDIAIDRIEAWCSEEGEPPIGHILYLRRWVVEAAHVERRKRGGTVAREARLVRLAARVQAILDVDEVVFPEPPPEPGDDVVPEWFLARDSKKATP